MKNVNKQWCEIITKSILEEEYLSGKSYKSIAKAFGCGETTIMRLGLKYGIISRQRAYKFINKRFGKLLVVKRAENSKKGNSMWFCVCDCGKTITVLGESLKHGATKSCGCLSKEQLWKGFGEISGTYWGRCERGAKFRGLSFNLTIQDAWQKFLDQNRLCALSGNLLVFNPKYCNPRSKVPEWQTASLDRIDSNKGYSLDNIQWVDVSVNYMKNDMSENDFIKFCVDVANFSGNR